MKTYKLTLNLEYKVMAKSKKSALDELEEKLDEISTHAEEEFWNNIKVEEEEEEEEEEERFCTKCGKTSGLLEDEDMCYKCATERGRC